MTIGLLSFQKASGWQRDVGTQQHPRLDAFGGTTSGKGWAAGGARQRLVVLVVLVVEGGFFSGSGIEDQVLAACETRQRATPQCKTQEITRAMAAVSDEDGERMEYGKRGGVSESESESKKQTKGDANAKCRFSLG
jgi:hypothetical protein